MLQYTVTSYRITSTNVHIVNVSVYAQINLKTAHLSVCLRDLIKPFIISDHIFHISDISGSMFHPLTLLEQKIQTFLFHIINKTKVVVRIQVFLFFFISSFSVYS